MRGSEQAMLDRAPGPRQASPPKAAPALRPRTCGGCTGCCTVMGIAEIGKPAGQRCLHECEAGCSIYPERPQQCKSNFRCLWLADDRGLLHESHRPDHVGLVLTDWVDASGQNIIAAREMFRGAAAKPAAIELLGFLRRFVAVLIVPAVPGTPVPLTREGIAIAA